MEGNQDSHCHAFFAIPMVCRKYTMYARVTMHVMVQLQPNLHSPLDIVCWPL